jgi:iodotyrosine deiodinase
MLEFENFNPPPKMDESERLRLASEFRNKLGQRRSLREFSDRPVNRSVIEECILAAGTAPSGANRQPWFFAAVEDREIKHRIRLAAEHEEKLFYEGRAGQQWLEDLEPLGTDCKKPFLEVAPWLIVVFEQRHQLDEREKVIHNYYTRESVGLATGMLITALHNCGLATLTYTPSPMVFLRNILGRPKTERPFMLIVAGHAATAARVPVIEKKELAEICEFYI